MRDAVDFVGDGNAPPQDGVVFDVVDHEGGVVQHLHHFADLLQLLVGDLKPGVEGLMTRDWEMRKPSCSRLRTLSLSTRGINFLPANRLTCISLLLIFFPGILQTYSNGSNRTRSCMRVQLTSFVTASSSALSSDLIPSPPSSSPFTFIRFGWAIDRSQRQFKYTLAKT